jgi:primary-amine oxidase
MSLIGTSYYRTLPSLLISLRSSHSYNALLSLHSQEWRVDTINQLPEGVHPQITPEELIACDEIIRADPQVVKLAADVGLLSKLCSLGVALIWL